MKILVLSDSHGIKTLMAQVAEKFNNTAACLLFLGDNAADCRALENVYKNPIHIVAGNCDFNSPHPKELILEINGKKIWMTHGDTFGVKSGRGKIAAAAKARDAHICLFGHTHTPAEFYENGIYFLNPGSISEPRGRMGRSYAILEIIGSNILTKIVEA